jgi:hypothetical protein
MKVLDPVGMIRSPKPFTSLSKTINGLGAGASESTARFVSLPAFVATESPPEKK